MLQHDSSMLSYIVISIWTVLSREFLLLGTSHHKRIPLNSLCQAIMDNLPDCLKVILGQLLDLRPPSKLPRKLL